MQATQQTVLVTGASSGIGEAIAKALQADGHVVYAAARRTERLAHLQELGIHTISLDVSDESSIQSALQTIKSQAGNITVLINNAGYGSYGSLEEVPLEEGRRQMEVNLFGLARLMQLATPDMRQAGDGYIINISSMGSRFGEPFGAWYHASKYAVEGLTDSVRMELEPFGVKVVNVQPGIIQSEWGNIAAENLEKNSAQGPYAEAAQRKAKSLRSLFTSSLSSPPEVIATKIVSIIHNRRPAFRYVVGGSASPILLLRRFTSDRFFYTMLNRR